MTTTVSRLARRASGAVLVAASTFLMAAPAHAATATLINPDWVDGCPSCPLAVNFRYAVAAELDPGAVERIDYNVAAATELLMRAAEKVPNLDSWRDSPLVSAAVAAYSEASNLAGNSSFMVAEDWDGDWCGNSTVKPKPIPHGPFEEADRLIAEGLTTLGEAAVQRDPAEATALQDRAAGALQQAAIQLASGW